MSELGKIGWIDLTVPDADSISDFYSQVAGWSRTAVPVEDYQDYCVSPREGDDPVAGICHQRGPNADMPAQWLIYISVEDLDSSMKRCRELDGQVLGSVRDMGGYGRMCVIQDPAGAVAALIEPK